MPGAAMHTKGAARAAAHIDTKRRFEPRPRFYCVQSFATLFADHLRLGTYTDLGRFHVGMAATADDIGASSSPVEVDLPVKDRRAYERACATFNAVMDEHQAREGARNERRQTRKARAAATSCTAQLSRSASPSRPISTP